MSHTDEPKHTISNGNVTEYSLVKVNCTWSRDAGGCGPGEGQRSDAKM